MLIALLEPVTPNLVLAHFNMPPIYTLKITLNHELETSVVRVQEDDSNHETLYELAFPVKTLRQLVTDKQDDWQLHFGRLLGSAIIPAPIAQKIEHDLREAGVSCILKIIVGGNNLDQYPWELIRISTFSTPLNELPGISLEISDTDGNDLLPVALQIGTGDKGDTREYREYYEGSFSTGDVNPHLTPIHGEAYPLVDVNGQPAPGKTIKVFVALTDNEQEAIENNNGQQVERIFFDNVKPEIPLMVVLSPVGGTVQGPSAQFMGLYFENIVRFEVDIFQEAEFLDLKIEFFYNYSLVGVATRQFLFESTSMAIRAEGTEDRFMEAERHPCAMNFDGGDPEIDLKIVVRYDGRHLDWFYTSAHIKSHAVHHQISLDNPQEFAQQINNDLQAVDFRGLIANRTLAYNGQLIADLMPPHLFDHIREITQKTDSIPRILLYTDEPTIPWELALFKGALLDEDVPGFLCSQTLMSRWWPSQGVIPEPPSELNIEHFTALASTFENRIAGRLPEVTREKEYLAEHHQAQVLQARLDVLEGLLRSHPKKGHALHVAVHGNVPQDPSSSTLTLEKGETGPEVVRIQAGQIAGAHRCLDEPRFAFMFLNACQVGEGGKRLGQAAGFPGAMLRGGVRGFIAPLWKVHDKESADFSTQFYDAVFKEQRTVAETLYQLRARYEVEDSTTKLAYIYYGHPNLKLTYTPKGNTHG